MEQIIKEKHFKSAKDFILKYYDSTSLDDKTKEEFGNLNNNLTLENGKETHNTLIKLYDNCKLQEYKREREEEDQGNIALVKVFFFGVFLIFIGQYMRSLYIAEFGAFLCFSILIGSFAKALG